MTALTKVESIQTHEIDFVMNDIEKMQEMSRKLVQSKHYQKMGEDGIFAIGMMAKSIGMPVLEALNGELYYIQGKVGMAAEAMNKRIRMAGHSVTLKHLDSKGCTLVGKRCDTGDTAEITYSLDDAKSAGKTYQKNEKDMYFARALSRLKRILFPDVCTKCYEKSEIEEIVEEEKRKNQCNTSIDVKPLYIEIKTISADQTLELAELLSGCDIEVQSNALSFIKNKFKIEGLDQLPEAEFERYRAMFAMRAAEYQKKLAEAEMNNVAQDEVLV